MQAYEDTYNHENLENQEVISISIFFSEGHFRQYIQQIGHLHQNC